MKFSLSILLCSLFAANLATAENLIRVKGQGEIKVVPDLAQISIEIWSRDRDAKRTQEANAKEMARVEKILKDTFKIDAKDLQTTQLNLNPDYRYENNGKRTLLGYQANHGLQVTMRDLAKLGGLMDQLIGETNEKFGTNVQGISFSTEKRAAYERDCLALAVKDAQSKAAAIAKASNTSLKEVRAIVEASANWDEGPRPMRGMEMAKTSALMADGPATNVSPGQITVNTQVIAEFNF